MQPVRIAGVKGDECSCGRRASVIHCTRCGSTRVYARLNRYHRMMNGELKLVEAELRCQACGNLFVEEEREWCQAPPATTALAKQKVKALHEASQLIDPRVINKAIEAQSKTDEAVADEGTVSYAVTDPKDVQELADNIKATETKQMSVAEREFRLEWARYALAGYKAQLPKVEEYIERRAKGEIFNFE